MRQALLIGLASAVLSCGSAAAEVRLRTDGSRALGLHVSTSGRGTWEARGVPDPFTLNPDGDIHGDGAPSHRLVGDQVLVAWSQPSSSTVAMAIGRERWTQLPSIVGESVHKVLVEALGSGWLVAWTEQAGSVRMALVTNDGIARTGTLDPLTGTLVDVVVVDEAVHALVSDRGVLRDIVANVIIDDNPIIFRSATVLSPTRSSLAHAGAEEIAVRITHHLFQHSDGSIGTALVWWTSTTSLSYIELTEDGPVLPVRSLTANGNGAKYPQSLVNEALRDLGR